MIPSWVIVDRGNAVFESVLHNWTNRNEGTMVTSIGCLYWGTGYRGAYTFTNFADAYDFLGELVELERHTSRIYTIREVYTLLEPVENRLGWTGAMPEQK